MEGGRTPPGRAAAPAAPALDRSSSFTWKCLAVQPSRGGGQQPISKEGRQDTRAEKCCYNRLKDKITAEKCFSPSSSPAQRRKHFLRRNAISATALPRRRSSASGGRSSAAALRHRRRAACAAQCASMRARHQAMCRCPCLSTGRFCAWRRMRRLHLSGRCASRSLRALRQASIGVVTFSAVERGNILFVKSGAFAIFFCLTHR